MTSQQFVQEQTPAPAELAGYQINFEPIGMRRRAAKFKAQSRARVISLLVSIAIAVGLFFLFKAKVGDLTFWLLVGSVGYSLALTIWTFTRYFLTRRALRKVPSGAALLLTTSGIRDAQQPQALASWEAISAVRVSDQVRNPGPTLHVSTGSESWDYPLAYLDAEPAWLDSALRAFSGGRFGLDLGAVEQIW